MKMLVLLLISFCSFGQSGDVKGIVLDEGTGESLVGVNVLIKGTSNGAITDGNGAFMLSSVPAGAQTLLISYIGYATREVGVDVPPGGEANLGTIKLSGQAIGLQEVSVIASVAIDRKTPVAVSTVKGATIEAKIGNQEFPEILRSTPSVYVTKQGGGFGDSRVNIRGFDQSNTAVMINGVPVNDMENGWVYWSNWAGLSDVTSQIQVQRGLGASKLAVPSVGGSINIITNAAEMEKEGSVIASVGNDGYQKYALMYSTGLLSNGWAFTAQGTHTFGDGYIDGTKFRAFSYFASVAKVLNDKHAFHLTALGAPQWHNQRTFAVDYALYKGLGAQAANGRGLKYNDSWGYLNGEEFNIRKNFYHKPKVFLNHYWTISDKSELSTSVYASFGRGGGTGDLGRINGSAYYALPKTSDGLLRLDDMVRWNQGQSVADFGADNTPDGNGNYYDGIIRRASMNEHNWFGMITNLTHVLSSNFTLVAGLDARRYRGLHYRRVEDLMGLDGWIDDSDVNNPGNLVTAEGRADGNQIAYNNDGLVNWLGLYGQLEYTNDKLSAFTSVSLSNQGFKRIDYFIYEDADPMQESDWQNFLGGTVKAGANYNIDDNHNVFVNGGFFSRQPIFDNVFPFFTNDVNPDSKNQSVYAFEAGYGLRMPNLAANFNLYHSQWGNRQFDAGVDADNDGAFDDRAIFDNVAQLHQGVEIDFNYTPVSALTINGMASLGNWRYTDDFKAVTVDEDNNVIDSNVRLYMKDVKIADAAQMTFSLGATYKVFENLSLYGSYYHADNVYAQFDLEAFLEEGQQVWELPSYGLVDAGFSYKFKVGGVRMRWNVNVNNLLDTEYLQEAFENNLYDPEDAGDLAIPGTNASIYNGVYFGFGRTWNTSLKILL